MILSRVAVVVKVVKRFGFFRAADLIAAGRASYKSALARLLPLYTDMLLARDNATLATPVTIWHQYCFISLKAESAVKILTAWRLR
ncbi:hypothetical protein [Pseudomonas sp. OIL-1]|uniref:hypothetical protein n=1 Tax=Pseudomonas sp. OIL-1 TaxID=2706126 RepID=UPI0013A77FA4|nr:hypothetical protein [Pseudomonas sp. OIL-1]QIB52801.1 hypothetical protein G3M63_18150 [Pseudomonas sp. OIL-1]